MSYKLTKKQEEYSNATGFNVRKPTFGFEDEYQYIEFIEQPETLKMDAVIAHFIIHQDQKAIPGYASNVREKPSVYIALDHVDNVLKQEIDNYTHKNEDYFKANYKEFLVEQIHSARNGFSVGIPEITSTPCVLDHSFDAVTEANHQLKHVMLTLRKIGDNRIDSGNWHLGELFHEHNFSRPNEHDKHGLNCDNAKVLIEDIYLRADLDKQKYLSREAGSPGRGARQVNLTVGLTSLIRGINQLQKITKGHVDWISKNNGYLENIKLRTKRVHFSNMMHNAYSAALSYINFQTQHKKTDFNGVEERLANFCVELMGAMMVFQIIGYVRQQHPIKECIDLVPKVDPYDIYAHQLEMSKDINNAPDFEEWFKSLKHQHFPADTSGNITRYDKKPLTNYIMDDRELSLIMRKGEKSKFNVTQPSPTRFVVRENTLPYDKETNAFVMEFRNGGSKFNVSTMYILPKSNDDHINHATEEAKKLCKSYLHLFH